MNSTQKNDGKQSIAVTAPTPYPPIEVEGRNPRYACMLQQDIASARGEMTAIYQYLYQGWVAQRGDPELAQTLMRIAGVEMHHLRVLGELVVLLGGDPRCSGQNGSFPWNGNLIFYHRDISSFLRYNISLEQSAVNAYTMQSGQIRDPFVSAQLSRFAEDERIHRDIFKGFLSRLQTE